MGSVCVVLYAHKDGRYPTINNSSLGELCAASSLCMLRDALLLSLPYSAILVQQTEPPLQSPSSLGDPISRTQEGIFQGTHDTHKPIPPN